MRLSARERVSRPRSRTRQLVATTSWTCSTLRPLETLDVSSNRPLESSRWMCRRRRECECERRWPVLVASRIRLRQSGRLDVHIGRFRLCISLVSCLCPRLEFDYCHCRLRTIGFPPRIDTVLSGSWVDLSCCWATTSREFLRHKYRGIYLMIDLKVCQLFNVYFNQEIKNTKIISLPGLICCL